MSLFIGERINQLFELQPDNRDFKFNNNDDDDNDFKLSSFYDNEFEFNNCDHGIKFTNNEVDRYYNFNNNDDDDDDAYPGKNNDDCVRTVTCSSFSNSHNRNYNSIDGNTLLDFY